MSFKDARRALYALELVQVHKSLSIRMGNKTVINEIQMAFSKIVPKAMPIQQAMPTGSTPHKKFLSDGPPSRT
jgi:hypothetical protein